MSDVPLDLTLTHFQTLKKILSINICVTRKQSNSKLLDKKYYYYYYYCAVISLQRNKVGAEIRSPQIMTATAVGLAFPLLPP